MGLDPVWLFPPDGLKACKLKVCKLATLRTDSSIYNNICVPKSYKAWLKFRMAVCLGRIDRWRVHQNGPDGLRWLQLGHVSIWSDCTVVCHLADFTHGLLASVC